MTTTKLLPVLLVLLAGFSTRSAGGEEEDKPEKVRKPKVRKTLLPKVIAEWKKSKALVGWLARSEGGEWMYLIDKPKDIESLPVFLMEEFKPGVMAKLPAPSLPFAIGLGATEMNNAGLKELAKFQNLRDIDLSHTKVTDEGLKELAKLKKLRSLDFGASTVTDKGLKELAKIQSLQHLYFGATAVTDKGIKELAVLKELKTLYLYKTTVTDATLKELVNFKKLQTLIISNTAVTEKGVAKLAKERPKLTILR